MIALTRKNALFAGSDGGAEHWAVIASLIECRAFLAWRRDAECRRKSERVRDRAGELKTCWTKPPAGC